MLEISTFMGGYDHNFYYVLCSENEMAVIDCFEATEVLEFAKKSNSKLKYIISTHNHFDHIEANTELLKSTNAKLVMHESNPCDLKVKEGDILKLGASQIQILYSPGHTNDSICILVDGLHLFTGDTLFVGKIGGQFYHESQITQPKSLRRLMKLSDNIIIYPGHDYGITQTSTIKNERETNSPLHKIIGQSELTLPQGLSGGE